MNLNNIFDKLGIYDSVAVLLSGISITTISKLTDHIFFEDKLLKYINEIDMISLLIISYCVGMIFQELSSFFQHRVIYKKNQLFLKAFKASEGSDIDLTQEEKEGIFKLVQDKLEIVISEEILYNYCKFYLIHSGNTDRIDKDQSIIGLSRSLSLYFFFLSCYMLINGIVYWSIQHLIFGLLVLVVSVLLYYRFVRFAKMRYIYVLRSFYYSYL